MGWSHPMHACHCIPNGLSMVNSVKESLLKRFKYCLKVSLSDLNIAWEQPTEKPTKVVQSDIHKCKRTAAEMKCSPCKARTISIPKCHTFPYVLQICKTWIGLIIHLQS
uniref:Uncharacterized protein n=1 Tax=Octopus bimaculoides TaxID=37653 RepID=A0A0L8HGY5_OCTBM